MCGIIENAGEYVGGEKTRNESTHPGVVTLPCHTCHLMPREEDMRAGGPLLGTDDGLSCSLSFQVMNESNGVRAS